jgi:hypothetical protein
MTACDINLLTALRDLIEAVHEWIEFVAYTHLPRRKSHEVRQKQFGNAPPERHKQGERSFYQDVDKGE